MSVFSYSYLQRAAAAAALVGLAAPAVGVFVVQRRLALLGDGIGHAAFAGAAVGFLSGAPPLITGAAAAVTGGVAVELLRARGKAESDVALAVIFYGGIAGGVLLTSLAGTPAASLIAFLFGSVLTVTRGELVAIAVLALVILSTMWLLRNALLGVCYDEELARVSGLPVRFLNMLIAGGAAATVAVAMRVVGALLIAALMVLPVATAQRVTRSFRATFLGSILLGVGVSVGGLGLSIAIDAAPGATIVVTGIGLLLAVSVADRLRASRRARP